MRRVEPSRLQIDLTGRTLGQRAVAKFELAGVQHKLVPRWRSKWLVGTKSGLTWCMMHALIVHVCTTIGASVAASLVDRNSIPFSPILSPHFINKTNQVIRSHKHQHSTSLYTYVATVLLYSLHEHRWDKKRYRKCYISYIKKGPHRLLAVDTSS